MAESRLGRLRLFRAVTATAGSTDWEEIDGLVGSWSLPLGPSARIETSTHKSLATTGRKTYRAGPIDPQDLRGPFNLDLMDPIHDRVLDDSETQVLRDYKIEFTDGVTTKWQFRGSILEVSANYDMNALANGNLAITVSGALERNYLGA